ncbi:MAG TPA: sensor histidine kinase [Longimicrobium sp.]|jgi:two-component system sensor histidine kinase UhpB
MTDGPRILRALLRVPLFYKILIANAALVLFGALLGSTLTASYVRAMPRGSIVDLASAFAVAGVGATVLVNAVILRLALQPLELLERSAARVQAGDLDARAPLSPMADRELEQLTRTFNGSLDVAAAYRERLREVAARALYAAEEERKRIARELHDETAQLLAVLLIRIRVVRNASDPEALEVLLDEMRREIGAALEGVRRFARGLRPPALDELGLIPAIESHIRSVAEVAGFPVRLDAEGVDCALSPEAELAVYRIVQEALSNVVRHAGAASALVRIEREPEQLVVCVEDDGRGFDVARVRNAGGLGLFGMSERAAYLGGRVDIRSTPGGGTRVRAEIPLSAAAS